MNPYFKNTLSVIAGLLLGSIVNMGIIASSGNIIPSTAWFKVLDLVGAYIPTSYLAGILVVKNK
ncbi:hypothetical protein [Leptospira licerasiae]|uniref:Phosphoenolpyruvate protein kinase n=1 Tax=Leptospira licerasiae str. MMD4847 TaxID=1049971 RepID=A0ABP2RHI9_9LEPT|nr:hypothetical protein [Leptospira licerasiae]EIE01031.1 hypothetical protein LEP1GSC185_3586 [Leptospira licerasiae serovar Varillal str. VAR 010]EJZ43954.1 hypothetical protein LEP1GSC178_2309 [Leptospira licerasiae str. MMD4847]